jgi:hypothetical protein
MDGMKRDIRAEIEALGERRDLTDDEKFARYLELAEMEVRALGEGDHLAVAGALRRMG